LPENTPEPPPETEKQRPRRRGMMIRRGRKAAATELIPAVADSTEVLPQVETSPDPEPRRRPRPRPNPPAEARSTVYVSRHAADPG
jgi:hypothetical protein